MMKRTSIAIAALALCLQAGMTHAQDEGRDRPARPRQQQRSAEDRGPGERGPRPGMPPLVHVLDANHDGVIDAEEIANASVALAKLDENGDGKLTREELRPRRPEKGPRERPQTKERPAPRPRPEQE